MESADENLLDRETVERIVLWFIPNGMEALEACRDGAEWSKFSSQLGDIARRLNVSNYVLVYEDERRIWNAAWNAVSSEEEQAAFVASWRAWSDAERADFVKEFARPGGGAESLANEIVPADAAAEQAQLDAFKNLSESEKLVAIKHGQYLWIMVLSWIHNTLAVMTHGEKMTSLVPKAMAGDREAFLKAIHIDA